MAEPTEAERELARKLNDFAAHCYAGGGFNDRVAADKRTAEALRDARSSSPTKPDLPSRIVPCANEDECYVYFWNQDKTREAYIVAGGDCLVLCEWGTKSERAYTEYDSLVAALLRAKAWVEALPSDGETGSP